MAVRIQRYRQQTATPTGLVGGGNPQVAPGADVGGALLDVAQGVAAVGRTREAYRKEQEESLGATWAAENIARVQREGARELLRLKEQGGEAGVGVIDGINGWITQQEEQLIEQAPTESAKRFLRERLLTYRGNMDLNALEYETKQRQVYQVNAIDRGIESTAAAVAAMPDMAEQFIAEQMAAYKATKLPPEVIAKKQQELLDAASVSYNLAWIERDPAAFIRATNPRIGLGEDSTREEMFQSRDSAMEVVSKIQEDAGVAIPPDVSAEAVSAIMVGGTVSYDRNSGQWMVSQPEGGKANHVLVDSLSIPKLMELRGRAEAEIARRENAANQRAEYGKLLFAQRLDNITSQLASGEPAQVPTFEEMAFYLGPERATLEMQKLQTYQVLQGELAGMDGMTDAQLSAEIANRPEGEQNRVFRDAAYQVKAQRADAILKARKDDPGGYVLSTSEPVQAEYAAYTAEVERVGQLGDAATPEDLKSVADRQAAYIAASNAEQRRLGIREPKLPNAMVESLTQQFTEGLNSNNPRAAASQLEQVASQMSGSHESLMQIQDKTGDLGAFAMSGVDGVTLKRLASAYQVTEAKMKELLPVNTTWSEVELAVQNEFAPLIAVLSKSGNNQDTESRYIKAGQLLAADYMRINGGDPNQAARQAYNELFANKNEVVGTYMVPKAYDVPKVQNGLVAMLGSLTAEQVFVPPEQGIPLEESAARQLRTIRQRGQWVNNREGTGVFLMADGGPVLDANGNPIQVMFADAQRRGMEEPPEWMTTLLKLRPMR